MSPISWDEFQLGFTRIESARPGKRELALAPSQNLVRTLWSTAANDYQIFHRMVLAFRWITFNFNAALWPFVLIYIT